MISQVRSQRTLKIVVAALLCLALSGCDWLADALAKLGMAPEKTVRISGETYFKLDKHSSGDGVSSQNGFLCVVHDPGCRDLTGEDGEDTFFQSRILPPLATVTGFHFEPIPPAGMAASYNPGPSGSFDTTLQPGVMDGSQTIKVRWHNACWGPYSGKLAVYRVSVDVRIKGDVDLIDQAFDPSKPVAVPACRSDVVPPPSTCGTSSVPIKLVRVSATSDGIIYAGTSGTGLVATCVNKLQRLNGSQLQYPVDLLKKGGEKCSDAAARIGPGIKLETSDSDQQAIFGEVNPKDPITVRACVESGTEPPEFVVLIATFSGTPI